MELLYLGTYEELLNNEGTFAEYINQYLNSSTTETIEVNKVDQFIPRSISRTICDSKTNNTDGNGSKSFQRSFSCESSTADVKNSKKFIRRQRSISNSIMPNEFSDEPIIVGDINEEIETEEQVKDLFDRPSIRHI